MNPLEDLLYGQLSTWSKESIGKHVLQHLNGVSLNSLMPLTPSWVPLQLLKEMPHLPQQSVNSLRAGRKTHLPLQSSRAPE